MAAQFDGAPRLAVESGVASAFRCVFRPRNSRNRLQSPHSGPRARCPCCGVPVVCCATLLLCSYFWNVPSRPCLWQVLRLEIQVQHKPHRHSPFFLFFFFFIFLLWLMHTWIGEDSTAEFKILFISPPAISLHRCAVQAFAI